MQRSRLPWKCQRRMPSTVSKTYSNSSRLIPWRTLSPLLKLQRMKVVTSDAISGAAIAEQLAEMIHQALSNKNRCLGHQIKSGSSWKGCNQEYLRCLRGLWTRSRPMKGARVLHNNLQICYNRVLASRLWTHSGSLRSPSTPRPRQ